MKKTLVLLAFIAATSMVALAHGDDKGKKGGCCSKDAKKEATASKKDACCSKDAKKAGAKSEKKATKTETASKN